MVVSRAWFAAAAQRVKPAGTDGRTAWFSSGFQCLARPSEMRPATVHRSAAAVRRRIAVPCNAARKGILRMEKRATFRSPGACPHRPGKDLARRPQPAFGTRDGHVATSAAQILNSHASRTIPRRCRLPSPVGSVANPRACGIGGFRFLPKLRSDRRHPDCGSEGSGALRRECRSVPGACQWGNVPRRHRSLDALRSGTNRKGANANADATPLHFGPEGSRYAQNHRTCTDARRSLIHQSGCRQTSRSPYSSHQDVSSVR